MMRTGWVLLLLASAGCTHARTADDASDQVTSKTAEPGQPATGGADPQAASQKKGLIAGGQKDPERVPVASSPAGLLKPGADEKVREKLGVKEKGGDYRTALQRFQREHDLPATGILDHRTAKELGLDPDDIFERARD
ncbi:MAG TPA: peptidoglycan-binding domain-containing protein [Polyangiaceae bacterium]|jgi:hypothetical protein|nr:peptidoglycan-binding domain-containing protein [Polyangiaceae bacterium]